MPPDYSNAEVKKLVLQNAELLEANNQLLKKLYRHTVWGLWIRIFWYVLIVGLPFALYFYVLEPYFTALGSNFEVFKAGINEWPGLKGIADILNQLSERSY